MTIVILGIDLAIAAASSGRPGAALIPASVSALLLGSAVLFWLFPMSVANRLVPRTRFNDHLRLPSQQALVVGCVILGLTCIVLRAVPSLASYLSVAAFWIASGQPITAMEPDRHIDGFVGLVELLAGIFLVKAAHAITTKIIPSPDGPLPSSTP